jgi:hypothetical protein
MINYVSHLYRRTRTIERSTLCPHQICNAERSLQMRIDTSTNLSKTTPDIGDYQRDRNGTDDVKRSVAKDSGGMDPSRGTPRAFAQGQRLFITHQRREKHVDNLCRVNLVPVHRQTLSSRCNPYRNIFAHLELYDIWLVYPAS